MQKFELASSIGCILYRTKIMAIDQEVVANLMKFVSSHINEWYLLFKY